MMKKEEKDTNNKYILSNNSPFLLIEEYKTLVNNLESAMPDMDSRCIAVASAGMGEGSSTNVVNIAFTLGREGKRVIVLDCDMRCPTIQQKLKIDSDLGLGDIIMGNCSIEEATNYIEELNIEVIPAGSLPDNASQILKSSKMQELITYLHGKYEYIIIDLSPINVVTDACLLAKQADGFLIVVRDRQSEYRKISNMLHRLSASGANIVGVIYTNITLQGRHFFDKKHYH